ncbi:MAG: type II toxin-antitoxin system RelE/ParE family toxin [Planctomycetota bacterium]|nr:type II toxin-antitoxin system RelE/ParE family toxin [Planctomycetota bacterium]
MYSVEFKPQAACFIERQSGKIQRQLIAHIEALAVNPRPAGCKLLYTEEKLYRIRSGNYRIIYQIQDKKLLVVIVRVGDRKDIYRHLGK